MRITYIAVTKCVVGFDISKALWEAYGMQGIRADSMTDAVEKVMELEKANWNELYFILINADGIDFLPLLAVLESETAAPIIVTTSNPCGKEHEDALNHGAAYYMKQHSTPEAEVKTITAILNSIKRRSRKEKMPSEVIIHNRLMLSPAHRRGFLNGREITLSTLEFDVLYFLLLNRGLVMTFENIYSSVWNNERALSSEEPVRGAIKRLRGLLRGSRAGIIIENIRGIGFRLADA